MASAMDSRLAYARLSAVATASRLPTANRGSNNSYTTSWDTTADSEFPLRSVCIYADEYQRIVLVSSASSRERMEDKNV